jgi:hypothetical protein
MQAGGDRQPAFFANRGTVQPVDHYAASVDDYTMSQCIEDNANFKSVSKDQREDKWTKRSNMPSGLVQQLCSWY